MSEHATSEHGTLELASYFEPGSLLKTLRKRHPYDFTETYELLQQLYGYEKYYVNLGYWKNGLETSEAGYELVKFLATKLEIAAGAALIDAGSGMGQAAVDLARDYELRRITGININSRQVRFAEDLRDHHGLADVIDHICGDASEVPHRLESDSYDYAIAVECISHFTSPERFLEGLRTALTDRGRLVFCLNIAKAAPSFFERSMMKVAYGFVPDNEETWRRRVAESKFRVVGHGDITKQVLVPAMTRSLRELDRSSVATDRLSALRKWFMRRGCASVLRSANQNRMSYHYFVIQKN